IVSIGSYYDKHVQIEILAKRKSGKMLAGECKYSKEPAKVNILNSLKEKCQKAQLNIADYVFFSKNGFSSDLEQMQDENITLLSQGHLSSLLDNLSDDDLLVYTNKKY
ncbi:MAG: ATPase, partial [Epsilonproteobacteria bacterium]